jgi:hypothetical protein
MTVADTNGHVQRLVSVVKMTTVLEECITEEQRSVVFFCGQKDSIQRIFIKKCSPFMVGSVCRVKGLKTGPRNSIKGVGKSQMIPDQMRKWLREQSKDFYAAGFDALIKRWGKFINVGGGYVGK